MPRLRSVPRNSRLQQILVAGREHWDHEGYDPSARAAFLHALQCQTPALGGRVYASGDEQAQFFNTCKSRACPSCGHVATIGWQRERWCALPEGRYQVLTLTMPDTLWGLFAANKGLCRELPTIAAEIIGSYTRVFRGLEAGVMPILHTFNPKLEFNCHIHALVMTPNLQSPGVRESKIFFDGYALMRSWRRLVIALLRDALDAGKLNSQLDHEDVQRLLDQEEKRDWWRVHVQTFVGKERFLRYAGRYLRRPPIAQRRIIHVANGFVKFWYKDKRTRRIRTDRCTIQEFIDRWAQHIPDRYRHSVRHFGLFAPRRWARVATSVFVVTGQRQRPRPKRRPWAIVLEQQFGRNPLLDSKGQPMRWQRHIAPVPT
jgi:hypothetical protein